MSSTIVPISCEDSPRRLMRLEVSWICSRIESMPAIVWRTIEPPLPAMRTEFWATSAMSAELIDTSRADEAISFTALEALVIWRA